LRRRPTASVPLPCRTIRWYSTLQWNFPLIKHGEGWTSSRRPGPRSPSPSSIRDGLYERDPHREPAGLPRRSRQPLPGARQRDDSVLGGRRSWSAPANAGRIVSPYNFVVDNTMPFDFRRARHPRERDHRSAHEHGIGTAGVAYGVKLMPLKALASDWDVIFGKCVRRRRVRRRHRARAALPATMREDHQHEPRRLRPCGLRDQCESARVLAGDRGGAALCGRQRLLRDRGRRQRVRRYGAALRHQPDERARGNRVAHSRRGLGSRRSIAQATPTIRAAAANRAGGAGRFGARLLAAMDSSGSKRSTSPHRHVPAAAVPVPRAEVSTSSATSATSARRWPPATVAGVAAM